MSTLLKIAVSLFISSGMQSNYVQHKSIEQTNPLTLAGTWAVGGKTFIKIKRINKTTTTKESVSVKCNTCPQVVFKNDGTGCINSENGEKLLSTFTWKLTGSKLFIFSKKSIKTEDDFLSSGTYRIASHKLVAGNVAIELVDNTESKQLLIKI